MKSSLLMVLFMASSIIWGQSVGADVTIIKKVIENFKSLTSYEAKSDLFVSLEPEGLAPNQNLELYLAFKKPDKIRVENRGANTSTIILYDNENVLFYLPEQNQFRRDKRENFNFENEIGRFHASSNLDVNTIKDFTSENSELEGKEILKLQFITPVPPNVFPFPYADSSFMFTTWFVEKEKMIILRTESITNLYVNQGGEQLTLKINTTSVVEDVKINEDLHDSLFVLNLPEDVQEMSSNNNGVAESELMGKQAEDFQLLDLKGNSHKLSDYKGKVLFLDFWATWCAPCRQTMPITEKIHNEFSEKGLVVLAINMAEKEETVKKYIDEFKYTFPTLLDSDGSVSGTFGIQAIPSFIIIDKDGKIFSYEVGFHGEQKLRAKLKEAGIE
jgi:thiol-disulfide isomerase/thioredoxin/outer membrane lipoprotein-sorting protein